MNKRINKALRKLEEFDSNQLYQFMFRDGHQEMHYVYAIREERCYHPISGSRYLIYYQNRPLTGDEEFGSKLEIKDIFPSFNCHKLGYLRNLRTGEKISLMPFRE